MIEADRAYGVKPESKDEYADNEGRQTKPVAAAWYCFVEVVPEAIEDHVEALLLETDLFFAMQLPPALYTLSSTASQPLDTAVEVLIFPVPQPTPDITLHVVVSAYCLPSYVLYTGPAEVPAKATPAQARHIISDMVSAAITSHRLCNIVEIDRIANSFH